MRARLAFDQSISKKLPMSSDAGTFAAGLPESSLVVGGTRMRVFANTGAGAIS